MPSTFLDLCTDSLSSIGQVGIGQTVSPEQAAQALRVANRMLQKFSTQRLLLPTVATRPFALTASLQDYVVGPSAAGPGSFVAARPLFVEAALAVIPGTQVEMPMSVLTKVQWGAIRDKGATCGVNGAPEDLWPEYTYPNLAFHVHPIPSGIVTIKLGTWELLQQFLTIADVVNLPPGYEEAITQNLAFSLALYYDMPMTPTLAQLGVDSLNSLKQLNAQGLGGAFADARTLQAPNLDLPMPGTPSQPGQATGPGAN